MRAKTTLLTAAMGMAAGLGQAAETRPNILYIMADDQRYDTLGCTGNPVLQTPNLDKLAQRGTSFTQAFAPSPICCISRVNVLTGQYARRHGVNDFFTQIPDLGKTYPGILQKSGYYTGFIGKWGTDETNLEYFQRCSSFFDFWGGSMHQSNFWHERECHFVKNNGTTDRTEFFCDCPPDARGAKGEQTRIGRKNIKNPIHQEIDVIPHKVEQFLRQRDKGKPFCLSISLKAPHGPWSDYADEVKELFKDVQMPIKASVNMADAESRPDFLKQSLQNDRGRRLAADQGLHGFLQGQMRDYYRLVAGIDICMGKILASLKEHGVDENTVIIYTSDHGHFLGEHGFDGKWLLYEESAHIPLIVYDPRNPKPAQTSDELALLIDMAPTMLALAGLEVPESMQGESLLPQVADPSKPLREAFFMEHLYRHGPAAPTRIEPSEGVRTRGWKYINYIDQTGPQAEELYDLENDPLEMNNLAQNPEYSSQLGKLRSQWRGMRLEATCAQGPTIHDAGFEEPRVKPPLHFLSPGSPGFAEARQQLKVTFGFHAGICVAGAGFAEGVQAAQGRQVAFIQGETPEALIHQPPPRNIFGMDVTGLVVGEEYEIAWLQTGCPSDRGAGAVSVMIGDGASPARILLDKEPVATKGEWQRRRVLFRASAKNMRLSIRHFIQEPGLPGAGTEVTLFDDFSIRSTRNP